MFYKLDVLYGLKLLENHNFIPEHEIHIKIGVDNSFKMCYQIANVVNPNKKTTTRLFIVRRKRHMNKSVCLEYLVLIFVMSEIYKKIYFIFINYYYIIL